MSDRGTGRTSRQLAALPDGGVFLVPHGAMADHCRHLLREAGRRHDAVRIVILNQRGDANRLRGVPRGIPWAIDHAFSGIASCAGYEEARYARMILDR